MCVGMFFFITKTFVCKKRRHSSYRLTANFEILDENGHFKKNSFPRYVEIIGKNIKFILKSFEILKVFTSDNSINFLNVNNIFFHKKYHYISSREHTHRHPTTKRLISIIRIYSRSLVPLDCSYRQKQEK